MFINIRYGSKGFRVMGLRVSGLGVNRFQGYGKTRKGKHRRTKKEKKRKEKNEKKKKIYEFWG